MAIRKLFPVTAKNQLQLVALLVKGNQRLVLQLFLAFRVLQNPSRKFELLKNLFRLWGTFLLNLRILLRKNNEPSPFILFPTITVITSLSDGPNVSLVHV